VHFFETKGVLRLTAQFRLRDALQNAIIWSSHLDAEKVITSSNINAKPAAIYAAGLEGDAIEEVAERLVQSFLGRQERTSLKLLADDDLPELEAGNVFAKKQLWQDAINNYRKSINAHPKSSELHKAYYNYACASMVIANYETAAINFRKALQLKEDETLYSKTLDLCLRIQEETALMKQYSK
jgi:tetratricopeptide (TPR) repeat protein